VVRLGHNVAGGAVAYLQVHDRGIASFAQKVGIAASRLKAGAHARCELEPLGLVGSKKGRPGIFTAENTGSATQHGYFSILAELSEVFTPQFETVPNDSRGNR
jgi:hypothetical protein